MAKSKLPDVGTIRGRGKAKRVWDGNRWLTLRVGLKRGVFQLEEIGKELESKTFGGEDVTFTLQLSLWQVGDFYVVTDDCLGDQEIFGTRERALKAFEKMTEEYNGNTEEL